MPTGLRERERAEAVAQRVYDDVKTRGMKGALDFEKGTMDRIRNVFNDRDNDWKPYSGYAIDTACYRMHKLIDEAPLIISFKAHLFYPAMNDRTGEYVNLFERIAGGTDHREDEGYNVKRDMLESALFGYGKSGEVIGTYATRSKLSPLARLNIENRVPTGLGPPIGVFATNLNARFVPAIRPRYATVNYAETTSGPEGWGDSFLELKDDCRQRATYICQDSFKLLEHCSGGLTPGGFRDVKWTRPPDVASERVATNHNLYRLLWHMPDNMFKAVLGVAIGKVKKGLTQREFLAACRLHNDDCRLNKYDYIEMHYHGTLNIHRDLKRIVVSKSEALIDPIAWEVYNRYWKRGTTPLDFKI